MKLKVLTFYDPGKGTGGSTRITLQNEYLIKNGDSVDYLLIAGSKSNLKDFGIIRRNFFWLKLYILKSSEYKSNRCQADCFVVDYSDLYNVFLLILFIRLFSKTKIILTVHAIYFTYRKNKIKNIVDRAVSRFVVHAVHGITTSGKAIDRFLLAWGVNAEKIVNIYPAVRSGFRNLSLIPKADRHQKKLLFVGRFHPIKGLDVLIQALSLCDKEKYSLDVVADDEQVPSYANNIKKLVKEKNLDTNINFCGKIEAESELIQKYLDSDIFVQPSLWDTSPITIVEAMCSGLPVVASNVGGIPDWVEDGITGKLVQPGVASELAKAITSLLDDRERRWEMGRQGYMKSLIIRKWTWEKVCAKYREALIYFVRRTG